MSGKKMDSTCLRWEDNLQFRQVLHAIIDAEPRTPKYFPIYGLLAEHEETRSRRTFRRRHE
jgi:hypothetical protein